MPRVRDINAIAQALAQQHEASFLVVCVPPTGLQVAFSGTPGEALKMPPLLRHIADEMEKQNKQAQALAHMAKVDPNVAAALRRDGTMRLL